MMPTCKELSRILASGALEEAGLGRRLAARLHLFMCRHCGRYLRQLRELGEAARRGWRPPPPEDLGRLERAILERVGEGGAESGGETGKR